MRLPPALALSLAAVAWSLACGPSFQVVYEGDSRFEHCYALDENPNVLMQQKSDCWSDWLQHYTYGQTRDRVEFAAVRYRAIMRAGTLPTDEAIMSAAPGEGNAGSALAAPAPTNAFQSPPKTLVEYGPAPSNSAAVPGPPEVVAPTAPTGSAPIGSPRSSAAPPGSTCIDDCTSRWQGCRNGCEGRACEACDKTYGKCVRGCFPAAR